METDKFIGQVLNGYKITEEIGLGGMATVYKAIQPGLGRWVAIKILHYREYNTRIRFAREAKAIAHLRHRNILQIYDYGEQDGYPYMVMEYVAGGTLGDYLQDNTMDWQSAIVIARQLTDMLHYAHGKGVIHRDIKPSNILMVQPDWPLLTDFGLAKLSEEEWEMDSITKTGMSLGTPSYVSPEQARGLKIDYRADIYSLGIVLYEMVTGRLPFEHENSNKLLLAHISEPVPPPTQFNRQCPPSLERVILKTLAKSPDERFTDMVTLNQELRQVVVSSTISFPKGKLRTDTGTYILPETTQSSKPQKVKPQLVFHNENIVIDLPEKKRLVIGRTFRSVLVDIDLNECGAAQSGVSRKHARLTKQGETWLLDDLGSTNGTYINGHRLKQGQAVPLKNGDIVQFSQLVFTFQV